MAKQIILRPTQDPFVNSPIRFPFFIGGIGSGKTFSGITRGVKFSQLPGTRQGLYGPRGCALAATYPILEDVVIAEFFEVIEGTGLMKANSQATDGNSWEKSRRIAHLHSYGCTRKGKHCCPDALILFRSLDKADWARGLNLSWFFIDEGRHVDLDAFHVMVGRLRQPGFTHSGWTTSTPNGHDWMWQVSHEDSPFKIANTEWYNASTKDNAPNLDEDFLASLDVVYKPGSPLYRQEVLGEFVGLMKGAVFEEFDISKHLQEAPYDPDLPLYSGWDFGIGDLGVVLFLQLEDQEKAIYEKNKDTGKKELTKIIHYPKLRIVGYLESANRNAPEWATEFFKWCDANTGGRLPEANYGDPAGVQRGATGTSWISELRAHGVNVIPVQKKPRDFAIHILRTMMARDGVSVHNDKDCTRFAQALTSHRWSIDGEGNRIGKDPVHDWTSHGATALGYVVVGRPELNHVPRASIVQKKQFSDEQWGAVKQRILHQRPQHLGPHGSPTTWIVQPVKVNRDGQNL